MISRIGSYEYVLQNVKRRQISWFGHIWTYMSRYDILPNTILQGHVEGIRKRGNLTINWMYDVYEWTGMSTLYLINVTKDIYIYIYIYS